MRSLRQNTNTMSLRMTAPGLTFWPHWFAIQCGHATKMCEMCGPVICSFAAYTYVEHVAVILASAHLCSNNVHPANSNGMQNNVKLKTVWPSSHSQAYQPAKWPNIFIHANVNINPLFRGHMETWLCRGGAHSRQKSSHVEHRATCTADVGAPHWCRLANVATRRRGDCDILFLMRQDLE